MTLPHDLRLARALFHLTVYFDALRVPFTLRDLYVIAYGEALWREMPGALWLDHLAADAAVTAEHHEFHTLSSILRTIHQAGLALLVDAIAEETAQLGIRMYLLNPGAYRRPPRDPSP